MPRKVRKDITCPKCGAPTIQTVAGKLHCTNPNCPVIFIRCKPGSGNRLVVTSIVEEATPWLLTQKDTS